MSLTRLINEGETMTSKTGTYNKRILEKKGEQWVRKSVDFLDERYPGSIITNKFMEESKKSEKNYNTMISILQGLKDVEEEIGMLDE